MRVQPRALPMQSTHREAVQRIAESMGKVRVAINNRDDGHCRSHKLLRPRRERLQPSVLWECAPCRPSERGDVVHCSEMVKALGDVWIVPVNASRGELAERLGFQECGGVVQELASAGRTFLT